MGHTHQRFQARTGLPVVSVVIGLSSLERRALKAANLPMPESGDEFPTDALLDTGAHRSFISLEAVKRLGLRARGFAEVRQPLMPEARAVPLYSVSMKVVRPREAGVSWEEVGMAPTVEVGILPSLEGNGSRVYPMPIIGRDVLSQCSFLYNGPERWLELLTATDLARRDRPWWRRVLGG